MQEYKKRMRLLAERHGLAVDYSHNGNMTIRGGTSLVACSPISKSHMTCTVTTPTQAFAFTTAKQYVFDIIHRLANGRSLDSYAPKGAPLSLQEYADEEHAASRLADLSTRAKSGTVENGELGGNHYNVEYYNGVLIVFDVFTGAPTNVIDFAESEIAG
jgi:hypothetical protein